MTSPTAHDFPDYGRQSAVADIFVTDLPAASINADETVAVKFVGNLPYVFVFGVANAGLRITLEWYGNQAATQSIGSDRLEALANVPIFQPVPVKGPFMRQINRLSAYPNTRNTTVSMTAEPCTQYTAVGANAGAENALIAVANGGPIGGGGNVILNATQVRGGEAYCELDVLGATNWVAYLLSVDFLGATTFLASFYGTNRPNRARLYIPAQTMQVQLFNQDAGAHDYRALLSFKNFIM